jgi:hypothetical protein
MTSQQNMELISTTDLSFARRCTREKERAVVDFIKQDFGSDGWVFDKTIDANNGYRPDALFRMSTHAIVVEVDENQHRGYDAIEEIIRVKKIQEDVGTPVIFIRFNPDKYVDNYGQTHIPHWRFDANGVYFAHNHQNWNARLQTLSANISKYMGFLPSLQISEVRLFFTTNKRKCTKNTENRAQRKQGTPETEHLLHCAFCPEPSSMCPELCALGIVPRGQNKRNRTVHLGVVWKTT